MKFLKKCLEVRYEDFTELECIMHAQYVTDAARLWSLQQWQEFN